MPMHGVDSRTRMSLRFGQLHGHRTGIMRVYIHMICDHPGFLSLVCQSMFILQLSVPICQGAGSASSPGYIADGCIFQLVHRFYFGPAVWPSNPHDVGQRINKM